MIFCAAVAALLRSASASDTLNAKTFPSGAVKTISIRAEGGAITVNVSGDASISTDVSPAAAPGDDCAVTQDLTGGVLTLTARSASKTAPGARKPCSAGFAVSAPADVGIKARSGSGDVELGAFSGKIDVRTGSGAIVLHGPSGALTLRSGSGSVTGRVGGQSIAIETGSGNVYLRGLTGSVKARSSGGAIAFAWVEAPKIGDIDVRTVNGDFLATLPEDAIFKFSLKSGSGKLRSDFRSDPSATLNLTFISDSGYATLRKRKRVDDMQENIGPTEVFDREDLLRW